MEDAQKRQDFGDLSSSGLEGEEGESSSAGLGDGEMAAEAARVGNVGHRDGGSHPQSPEGTCPKSGTCPAQNTLHSPCTLPPTLEVPLGAGASIPHPSPSLHHSLLPQPHCHSDVAKKGIWGPVPSHFRDIAAPQQHPAQPDWALERNQVEFRWNQGL